MLRVEPVRDDASNVIDEQSGEVIFTVWRADGEKDNALLIRSGCIAKCINDEIRRSSNKKNHGTNKGQL
jgi:hypothetical protein